MKNTTLIGEKGENTAVIFLKSKQYIIIDKNFRCKFGEIDIIAKKDDFLIFIEVKTRKSSNFGRASEFVDKKKQEKIIITAQTFIQQNQYDLQPRFDVIEVYNTSINHIESAFECS